MKFTLADIAKKANVSKMTVSRVISGKGQVSKETSKRIKKIINDFGYQPNLIARSLASNRSMIIGVIIPKIEQMFFDNYIAQILSGVTDVAMQNDYRIMLCPIEIEKSKKFEYLNIARSRLFDGMILLKTKFNDPNIPALTEKKYPFVLVSHKRDSKKINFVDSENEKGAHLAMKHLYDLGHRDIAFVAGIMEETNGIDRFNGYKDAIRDLGLTYRREWVIYGDFNKEKAYVESKKLFTTAKKPTAIFCSDDYMAIGVMERIKEMGLKVPNDIAIIGFDDIEIAAYVKPELTTIRQPIYELGKTATKILLDHINNDQKKIVHKFLNVELIKRNST